MRRVHAAVIAAAFATLPIAAQVRLTPAQAPLCFEENRGQHPDEIQFTSRGAGYALGLTAKGSTMLVRGRALRLELVGAASRRGEGRRRSAGHVNYFVGNDRDRWVEGAPLYREVRFRDVYPGIDVVYHGRRGELEYDFVVAPGVDPAQIRLRFRGADRLELEKRGDLVLHVPEGRVQHERPFAFQIRDGEQQEVEVRFRLVDGEVSFELGDYDSSRELVIDPVLVYSTFLGGTGADQDCTVVADSKGSAIVFGYTFASDFPIKNEVQKDQGGSDCFVTKFTPDGSDIVYSTYLGSLSPDEPGSTIALGPNDSVCICARVGQRDWPTTANAYLAKPASGQNFACVTQLSAGGGLVYSTYFANKNLVGSVQADVCTIDPTSGVIFLGGRSSGGTLPTTNGAFQPNPPHFLHASCFVAKFDPRQSGEKSLVACTYFSGQKPFQGERFQDMTLCRGQPCFIGQTTSEDLPTKGSIHGYKGRQDAFVTVLNGSLSALVYSTYLGGAADENKGGLAHVQSGIGATRDGKIWAGGTTNSTDFPLTADAIRKTQLRGEGYVCLIDPTKSGNAALVYSTLFGGMGAEVVQDLVVDGQDRVWISGQTNSTDLPAKHSLQATQINRGFRDAFVSCLGASGKDLVFSTFFGGIGHEQGSGLALGPGGSVFLAGTVGAGTRFPITPRAFQPNAKGFATCYCARIDITFAAATNYGAGHPGKNGVPSLTATPPVLGTTSNVSIGSSTDVPTVALLALGLQKASLPTPFGGTLLVVPFTFVTVPLPPTGALLPFAIPADNNLCGAHLYFQSFVIDLSASVNLAFSRGLDYLLGI